MATGKVFALRRIIPTVNGENWEADSNASYTIGDVVIINIRARSLKQFSSGSYIGINLPKPANPDNLSSGSGIVYATNRQMWNITLLVSGHLYANETVQTNTMTIFSFVYKSTASEIEAFVSN